jgi:hypothetical protein
LEIPRGRAFETLTVNEARSSIAHQLESWKDSATGKDLATKSHASRRCLVTFTLLR